MAATLADLAAQTEGVADLAEGVARLAAANSKEAGGQFGTEAAAQFARVLVTEINALYEEIDQARREAAGGRGEVAP